MAAVAYRLLSVLVRPGKVVAFISYPDVSDSCSALFSYAVKLGHSRRNIVWLVTDVRSAQHKIRKIVLESGSAELPRIHKKNSLIGLCWFLRSSVVFFTHGHFSFVRGNPRRACVNLWHGMPIKAIGHLDGNTRKAVDWTDWTIASSEYFRPVLAQAFGVPVGRVLVTGLPRCDLLRNVSAAGVRKKEAFAGANRLVVWMPTYKHSIVGDIRVDAQVSVHEYRNWFHQCLIQLNDLAVKYGLTFLVKLHPMDLLNSVEIPADSQRVLVCRSNDPRLAGIELYEMLAAADGLISDLSSVVIDYMSTGRPILITTSDIDVYTRDLAIDPALLLRVVYTATTLEQGEQFYTAVKSDMSSGYKSPLAPINGVVACEAIWRRFVSPSVATRSAVPR
ncbi:CDP-glycerol glycerophosphotransferase family protein [Streptococcus pyogenes]|uniref:CDP-glycerol glycerophosphotransferase family protein n=1 Tax=Streptococcus pyogenes TaxID=1314 RepID=UPI003DA13327